MLQIQCTQKVFKLYKIQLQDIPVEHISTKFGVWYVNSFILFRKSFLLFVNDPTLYSVPIYISGSKRRINLEKKFKENLFYALLDDGISEQEVSKKIAEFGEAIYTKTTSRSILGCMNDLMQIMYYRAESELENAGVIRMRKIQNSINRVPQRTIGWEFAVDTMRESFES